MSVLLLWNDYSFCHEQHVKAAYVPLATTVFDAVLFVDAAGVHVIDDP